MLSSYALVMALLLGWAVPAGSADPAGPVMETLVTRDIFKSHGLDSVTSFEPSPWGGLVFVSKGRVIWSRGWSSLLDPLIREKKPVHVREIVFLPNKGLVGVAGNRAAVWDAGRFKIDGESFPNSYMSVAANPKDTASIFVYGGKGRGQDSIYRFAAGRLNLMVQAPGAVTAFAAGLDALYYAVGPVIYRQDPGGKPSIMFKQDGFKKDILYLDVDEANHVLYASSKHITFALDLAGSKKPRGFVIKGFGGPVKAANGKLYLLDNATGTLLSFPALSGDE